MTARIGFGTAAPLRTGVEDASRYMAPPSLHLGALWLAATAPMVGLLILLGAR